MNGKMSQLAPSILAADFNRLGEQLRELSENEIQVLHIDVMDGMFVPSISFGMPVITSIRKESSLFFDVHLMVQEPARYIDAFAEAGADSVTVHVEACKDVAGVLQKIKEKGIGCGICLNPATPVDVVVPYLSLVDMVLVMSVEPGFGGQKFKPEALKKVSDLVQLRAKQGLTFKIEIDGGVNAQNIGEIVYAGVDIVVAGTAVFRGSISDNIRRLKGEISDAFGEHTSGKNVGNLCK